MRLFLKTLGYAMMVLSAALTGSELAILVAAAGEDSLASLARLYGFALVAVIGYLLWRAGERRPPVLRNPAWHVSMLLAGVLLALLAGGLLALVLSSILSNEGQPQVDSSTWGLLIFLGGAAFGGIRLAFGEYRRFDAARRSTRQTTAQANSSGKVLARWSRIWGWLRFAASLLLGLALVQTAMALLERSQTTNGMDIGARSAGVLAWLILPLAVWVLLSAALTVVWLVRPDRISGALVGSAGALSGVIGIVFAWAAAATLDAGSILLLPAVLLFLISYPASLVDYARQSRLPADAIPPATGPAT